MPFQTGAQGPSGYRYPGNKKAEKRRKHASHRNAETEPVAPGYQTSPHPRNAEQQARKERKQSARARAILKAEHTHRLLLENEPPGVAKLFARGGVEPPKKLAKTHRSAYRSARRIASEAKHPEGLKEDPLAEFVISSIATAGLGAGAKLAGSALKAGAEGTLARGGETLASKGVTAAETATEKGVKAVAKRGAKGAAKKAKAVPKRVKARVATKEGRRTTLAKEGERLQRAGKQATKHPVRYSGAANAAAYPTGASHTDLSKRASAFAEGTAAAVAHHPQEVAETTVHGVLGGLTAPLALGGAAVESVKEGSIHPLAHETATLGKGLVKMGKGLSSGDPQKVEQTTIKESGLTPFIPVPHVLRRLKGTSLYEDSIRGRVRGRVESKRAMTRDERTAAQEAARKGGDYKARRKATRKVRHSVPDSARPGEHYTLRRTGKLIEKQRSRHRVSREVARMEEEGVIAGGIAGSKVLKALKKSKGANRDVQNYGDALRIFAKHGLPKDQAKGLAIVEMLHKNWPKFEEGVAAGDIHLDRDSTQFILDHPQIFKDKHFWNAVEEFERQSKFVGTSPRNQFLAQVHNVINPLLKRQGKHRILTPEEMVPDQTASLLRKAVPTRKDPWSRTEALNYAKDLAEVTGRTRAKALKIKAQIESSLEDLMKPPEHGGAVHGVSTTQAVAWTPEMERAFVKAAKAEGQRLGLRTPAAYVADVVPSSLKGGESIPAYGGLHPVNKVWPSQGKAARSGNAESSLESVLYHSLESPHARTASVRGLQRIFDYSSRKVAGRRYLTEKQWNEAANTHQIPDGVIPVRTQMLRALIEGDHPVSPEEFRSALFNEVERGQKLVAGQELAGEIKAAKELGVKGEKFAPMDAVAIHELAGHMEGPKGASVYMGHATNFATRTILNSPAFEMAQFAQEGIPMAAALGRDLSNVPAAIHNLGEISKLDPQTQAMIRAVVGSSVGVLGAPKLRAWKAQGFMDPIRAAGGKSAWRHTWEVINGTKLSNFDRARAGLFREVGAMARISGDLRRAEKGFRLWRSSAQNLFKGMEQAVKELEGKNPAERMAYVAEHPELGDRLMKGMSGMAGNWNAFTVFEKNVAPFTIFYPFQRYSVLWMLYHFPLDHPVVATGLAALGEVNAQELQKIAARTGSTPSILDYAKPVVNGNVLPAGQRFSSVLGAVQQAVIEGKPMQAIGGLSPALSIPIEAISGKNSFTGAPLGMSGWEYLASQGLNLSPLYRFLGGGVKIPGLDTEVKTPKIGGSDSAASKLFESQDPLRQGRSFGDPYIGQSGKQYANEKRLERKYDEKYGEGHQPGPFDSPLFLKIMFGNKGGLASRKEQKKALEEVHHAESATRFLKHEEAKFQPRKPLTKHQERFLEEWENAWKTGPNTRPKAKASGGTVGGGSGAGIGGHPLGGSIGGSAGGGIGGHPIGGAIGGTG